MSRRRWALVVVGVVVVVVGAALLYARPILLTATGYAAHNACAVELLIGRPAGSAAEDLPPNPLVPLLRTTVDAAAGTATATLIGTFGSTAVLGPYGCVLTDDPAAVRAVEAPPAVEVPDPDVEWPAGDAVVEGPAGLDDHAREALEAALDAAFAEDDPEGRARGTRAVVVVHEGRIVAERYADGFTADTVQLGWSMAKSITSTLVGRLVAEGVVSLEDRDLLAAWIDDERSQITLEDLLRMASGLAWDETYDLGTAITAMLYLEDDMGAFAADQPLAHAVGLHQQYSSGTTNIVCDVLHQRSGLGPEMAHELVFGPLGMASAVIEPDAAGDLVCSSYAWATPRDWARFGWWVAQDGEWGGEQLLPPGWMAATTVDAAPVEVSEEVGHAAHWWVNRLPDGSLGMPSVPEDTFWASGHDGQRVMVVPSAGVVVVRMGFTPQIPSAGLGLEDLLRDVLAALATP